MDAKVFLAACEQKGINFFSGVPDSQLKGLCDTLYARYGVSGAQHVVAANEGGALALCAGHYLATGKPALCYMQNSGLGNAVNPLASLMDPEVYALPCLLVVGWRGEPGVHDEPQHVKQGAVTLKQLEILDIPYMLLDKSMTEEEFTAQFDELTKGLEQGRCVAVVVRKGGLSAGEKVAYPSADNELTREKAVEILSRRSGAFVCTTGKTSRELFEVREAFGEGHERDFLTVGSMGHASMIAAGIAMAKPEKKIWCLDGDGAALMHLGAMAVLAKRAPKNMVHVVINNQAHESVGGMPVCEHVFSAESYARAAGYPQVLTAANAEELAAAAEKAEQADCLTLLEVKTCVSSREDLGRPTTTPTQNRDALMAYLRKE